MQISRTIVPAAAALAATSTSFAATSATDTDKAFVAKVSQGGAYEVAASKIAEMRAQAMDVRDLAIWKVHDHEGVGMRLKALAASTGAPLLRR